MPFVSPLLPVLLAAAPLTWAEALARADQSPALTAAREAAATRQEAQGRLGAMTSNPVVYAQPGVRTEGGTSTGPEGQLSVQQSFNLAGLASARREVAGLDLDAARHDARARRKRLRIAVAQAWLDTWALTEAARAVHDEKKSADELVERLTRAAAVDAVTKLDLATARAFAAEAHAYHLDLEGRAVDASGRLAVLLGLDGLATVTGPPPDLDALAAPPLEQAAQLPALRLLEAQVASEKARAGEVAAQSGTALQVQLQGGHEAPTQWYANVSLGVTLPLFDVALRDVTSHRAQARLLEGELAEARAGARVELELLRHELEHAGEVFDVVHGRQLPAALEADALQARRFQGGEATLLELVVVRRAAVAARVQAIHAKAALLAARARAQEVLDDLARGGER